MLGGGKRGGGEKAGRGDAYETVFRSVNSCWASAKARQRKRRRGVEERQRHGRALSGGAIKRQKGSHQRRRIIVPIRC